MLHETHSLEEVNCSPGLAEEDVPTTAHVGSLERYRNAAVIHDAVDHPAVNESCSIDHNRDAFERMSPHNLHSTTPETAFRSRAHDQEIAYIFALVQICRLHKMVLTS
jgi:hypothetical protein